jgi:dinuclear metal center YbgI/SA1388 family protein
MLYFYHGCYTRIINEKNRNSRDIRKVDEKMPVLVKDIVRYLDQVAPPGLAEEWDNIGLLVGDADRQVRRVLIALDVTPNVLEEAQQFNADLIVSHHPVIYKPIKGITGDTYSGRLLLKAIDANISIYCMHTNYDVAEDGLNDVLARELGLLNIKGLNEYKSEALYKVVVFVPVEAIDKVRNSMAEAGAGFIGNYSDCTFSVKGVGTFRPLDESNPYIGTKGEVESVDEYRLESIIGERELPGILKRMIEAHPYEEPAYDVYKLSAPAKKYWLGRVGELGQEMTVDEFIEFVREKLGVRVLQLAGGRGGPIKKTAVFCGSFDGNMTGIMRENPDVLLTGEIKYHNALELVETGVKIIQAGHFNTERLMEKTIASLIGAEFPQVDSMASKASTDVFEYR